MDEITEFEGYGWYDDLPRVDEIDFTIWRGGQCWTTSSREFGILPDDLQSGAVDTLLMDLTVLASGRPGAVATKKTFELDVLVAANEASWIEDTTILISKSAKLSPDFLVDLIEASVFCASDDAGSDSWQTQRDDFCNEARDIANKLLLGEEEALLESLRCAFHDHMRWLIPADRRVTLSGSHHDLTLSLSPVDSLPDK